MGSKDLKPFKDKLPDDIILDLPMVEGHKLDLQQWLTFQYYIKSRSMAECIRQLEAIGINISIRRFTTWRKTDWWKALVAANAEFFQENFYLNVLQDARLCHEALIKIWTEKWGDPQTANAVVASFRELNKMGKGTVDPIAQNRREYNLTITHEEKISTEVIHKVMPYLNPAELDQFAKDGKVPDRLRNMIEIEIDAEDMGNIE